MGILFSAVIFTSSIDVFFAISLVVVSIGVFIYPDKAEQVLEYILSSRFLTLDYSGMRFSSSTSSPRDISSTTITFSATKIDQDDIQSLPEHLQIALGVGVQLDIYEQDKSKTSDSTDVWPTKPNKTPPPPPRRPSQMKINDTDQQQEEEERLKKERQEQEEDLSFARRILGAVDLVSVNERIKQFENTISMAKLSVSTFSLNRIPSKISLKQNKIAQRFMIEDEKTNSPSSPHKVLPPIPVQNQSSPSTDLKSTKQLPQIPKKNLGLYIKRFIQREEDYLNQLGHLLPRIYKNPIMELINQRNIEGEKEVIEKLFNYLINMFSADKRHLKLMQLKRHVAQQSVSEANDKWLEEFGEIILDFVQETLITKYIDQYLVDYTQKGLRYRIQKILLADDKQLKHLIESKLDVEARASFKKEQQSCAAEFLTFDQLIQQPAVRLTYYLIQLRDVFHPLIPENHPCSKLDTAIYKLEKKMITTSEVLEMAYQLNRTFEIQNRLNIENLESYTAFDLESNLSSSMRRSVSERETSVYKTVRPRKCSILEERVPTMPRFIFSVQTMDSTCLTNYYDSNDKLIYQIRKGQKSPPCEAYLFENVLIISWMSKSLEQGLKREKKLYFIDHTCMVEKWGDKGFKLVYAPEKQKIFECESAEERRRWIHYLRSIVSGSLLSANETKQIVKHLRSVSSLERPEARYSEDLDTLMKRRSIDHAKFEEPEIPGVNVAFAEDGSLIGATLEKLIEKMTMSQSVHDLAIKDAFLLTYHSFTTAEKVLELLILKWNLPPPSMEVRSNSNLFKQFELSVLAPTRINIYGICKRWVADHSTDFKTNPSLVKLMSNFIENHMAKTFDKLADNLRIEMKRLKSKRDTMVTVQKQYLEKQMKEYEEKDGEIESDEDAPKPIFPSTFKTSFKSLNEVRVLDWSSVEIARQITLIESAIFQKIQPKECLAQAWNKNKTAAPNICEMIHRTNTVVLWVAHQILENKKEDKRAKAIRKFIKVAHELRKLNNFNGLKEIIGGLRSVPIMRLKKTWALVPKKHLENYKELEKIVSTAKNYKEMRSTMKECHPPLIPFIGLYLTDLTFIEDGNKDYINEEKKIINFFKRQKLAFVIQGGIKRYQKEYKLKPVTELKNKLTNMVHFSEEKLIELSCTYEPKDSNQ
nr:unnamed protein product [Naegleria fowleri]